MAPSLIAPINHTELFDSEPRKQLLSSLETECLIGALPMKQSSIFQYPTQSKDVYPSMSASSSSNDPSNDQCLEIEQNSEQAFQNDHLESDISSFENSKKSSNICPQKVKQEEHKENIDSLNQEHLACQEQPINLNIKCEVEDFLTDSGFESSDSRPDVFECTDKVLLKRKCDLVDYPSKKVFLNSKLEDSPANFEITGVYDKFLKKNEKEGTQDIVYKSKSEKEETQNKFQLINEEETRDNNYQLKNEKVENRDILHQPINKGVETLDIKYKMKNENMNIQDIKHQIKNEKVKTQDKYQLKNEKAETQGIKHQAINGEEETQDIKRQIKNEKVETQGIKYEMKNENMNILDIKHQIINKMGTQDKYHVNNEKAETQGIKHHAINREEETRDIKYQIKNEKLETRDIKQQPIKEENTTRDIKYKANVEYQMKLRKEAITASPRNDLSIYTKKSSYLCIQANSEICPDCPPCHTATQKIDADWGEYTTKMKEKLIQNVASKLSLKGFESSPCFQDAQDLVVVLIQFLRVMMLPTFLATFVHSTKCTRDHSKLCSMFKRLFHHVVISNHHCAVKEVYGHILRLHLDSCSQNDCKFPKCQILRQNRKKILD